MTSFYTILLTMSMLLLVVLQQGEIVSAAPHNFASAIKNQLTDMPNELPKREVLEEGILSMSQRRNVAEDKKQLALPRKVVVLCRLYIFYAKRDNFRCI
jgi:hypothetical protein